MQTQRLTQIVAHVKEKVSRKEFEDARSAESELMRECLLLISSGHHDPKRVALLGLQTAKLKFVR